MILLGLFDTDSQGVTRGHEVGIFHRTCLVKYDNAMRIILAQANQPGPRLRGRLQQLGLPTIFVATPVMDEARRREYDATIRRFLSDHPDVTFINHAGLFAPDEASTPLAELYFDWGHLTHASARRFSAAFANDLAGILAQSGDSRPVAASARP